MLLNSWKGIAGGLTVKELIGQSKRIILVTSAYHMDRAQKLFEKQGIKRTS